MAIVQALPASGRWAAQNHRPSSPCSKRTSYPKRAGWAQTAHRWSKKLAGAGEAAKAANLLKFGSFSGNLAGRTPWLPVCAISTCGELFRASKAFAGSWEAAKVANLLKSDAPASALFSRLAVLAGCTVRLSELASNGKHASASN